jgi:hypothetical protein
MYATTSAHIMTSISDSCFHFLLQVFLIFNGNNHSFLVILCSLYIFEFNFSQLNLWALANMVINLKVPQKVGGGPKKLGNY